ncbi:MAG: divalent cation tolerance protein CutA [Xanthomonadales bacterium]|nr:divalent cation tolerance protein CutA [Xanthomonadales bacterium]NIN60603.1 divalent cation tolerance protein CutA [Xanthomonadales bacterium]NIN75955.1 divalent cation tolerance protein CutA [Xanthomonadales bacterium]NIO15047.1 divalent cation tolerance protein CutA [Xanthomonadales bacterium]NIP12996.1 divalent cation tolerance protein CutA [Xanthomonadales bacterium]
MRDALVVLCTCPDIEVAERLAAQLVERGLAACVNVLPDVRSIYRWQGEVNRDREVLLVIKTLPSAYADLEAWINEHHPYDVPEVVALAAQRVAPEYLAWMERNVQP